MNDLRYASIATAAALFLAVPWIFSELVWCGWLGAALALTIAATGVGRAKYCWPTYSVFVALVLAFHWAPESLASQLRSGYLGGLLAFLPLLGLDVVRAALPFWFVSRLGVSTAASWLPAGCCAVVCESFLPTVFPWRYGYMQAAWPWTVQLAELLGTPVLTLLAFAHAGALIVVIGGVWNKFFRQDHALRRLGPIAWLSVALCLMNVAYGGFAVRHWQRIADRAPKLSVALVQAEPGFTGSVATMQRLTRQVSQRADLVCWPESSSGTYASTLTQFSDPGQIFEQSREPDRGLRPWPSPDCSLLVGATIYDGNRDRPKANYQSALLIDPHEQIVGIYRKRHLMPFGEYVPGEDWFPWRQSAFSSDDALSCGNQANVLSDGGKARLGVLLCYEDMLPSAAASMTVNSANLLISLINASAFEAALPRYQHRMLAQLRAVENRRYLLRCAATGETCVVSPWGTIEARLPLGDEGVLKANVALLENPTWANWGSHGLAACCVAGMVWFWLRARSA